MYCQYCGSELGAPSSKCATCGKHAPSHGISAPWRIIFFLGLFTLGMTAVYLFQSYTGPAEAAAIQTASSQPAALPQADVAQKGNPSIDELGATMAAQVNPPGGYQLPVSFGDLGPKLIEAGAIDFDLFVQTYNRSGQPLNGYQLAVLTDGSEAPIVIDQQNAYFLLNFFWALGLTNQNQILEEGAMMQNGPEGVGRFASTGGWTIGQKPATELYSSVALLPLNAEQQLRVETVASGVYRPCCGNHTAFPDCNHGMAMLGMLELMAFQDASEDEMFEAAKYMNAYWFPQQALETAVFFKVSMDLDYGDVDGRMAAGPEVFSSAGFNSMHQWLVEGGELPTAPNSGGSCGV